VKTLEVAKEAGMDLCAGVILGMGETPTDRVEAAIALQDIGISSLPVNVLNPVEGTPLYEQGVGISTEEIVKTVAVYKLLHPESRVRLTGGREVNLAPDEQHLPLEAGADGLLTGDYLTTEGQSPGEDIEIIERAGLEPNQETNEFDPEEVKARHSDAAESSTETAARTGAEPSDD